MHQKNRDTAPCVCDRVRQASRALTRAYDNALAPAGMTVTQFSLLRKLARTPQFALSRLAEAMVMDRTTLYRALGPLVEHGWVTVEAADRRAKNAVLTPSGRAALHGAEPHWQAAQRRVHDAVGGDVLNALFRGLDELAAAA